MDSAPLPPHERTWRHPSEIAAAAAATEREPQTSSASRSLTILGGVFAVALVAALVVTVTPSAGPTTTAISATTVPSAAASREAASTAVAIAASIRHAELSIATGIPTAIADLPTAAFGSTAANSAVNPRVVLPDLHENVMVLTEQYAYAVAWRDVALIPIEGNAIVVDASGSIVARIDNGRLVVSHDTRIGASVSLD